jgi:hypothetical protein
LHIRRELTAGADAFPADGDVDQNGLREMLERLLMTYIVSRMVKLRASSFAARNLAAA